MIMDANAPKSLHCVVVTPERTVLDDVVDFVALPMYDGELGVLPGRAPLIGRLGAGELRTRKGNAVKRFYVDGGFAQVKHNVVTVLTPRAVPAEELDPDQIRVQMEQAARRPAETLEARDAKQAAIAKARVQLRLANRGTGTAFH
jgi:F-type H+-transporting ATPase subunit epsilon